MSNHWCDRLILFPVMKSLTLLFQAALTRFVHQTMPTVLGMSASVQRDTKHLSFEKKLHSIQLMVKQ